MKNKKILFYLLLFVVVLIPFVNVGAKEEFFQADDNLNTTGTYDGTVFFAAENLKSDAIIDGIGFSAGNTIEMNGMTSYGFVAGNKISFKGQVLKDIFIAGNNVSLETGSSINRDVYIASSSADISSSVGRNLHVKANKVTLNEGTVVNGNLYIESDTINFSGNVRVLGTLKYNENANVSNLTNVIATSVSTYKTDVTSVNTEKTTELTSFIISLIGLLVIGLISYILFPHFYENISEQNTSSSGVSKSFGIGLLTLITMPILSIILICTIIGIPLGLILFVIYAIFIYFSKVVVSYILGKCILTKAFKQKYNGYYSIIIGVIILKLLGIVPLIGGLINFVVLCIGLGFIIFVVFNKNKLVKTQEIKKSDTKEIESVKDLKKEPTTTKNVKVKKTSIKKEK